MTKLACEWVYNRPFESIMVFLKKAYSRVNYHKLDPESILKVPGKKHSNFQNFSVDKSEESWGKLVLKNC